ncbi:MAG TPA: transglutaminase family protein [Ktedonobacteraceae bacterium]|nr:transglutaminase family protein [Ktedonobacteraceae bacterium]
MYYTIRHTTRFRYSAPINESIMEVRMQPRSEDGQFCLDFHLHTSPRAQIMTYRGEFGNRVHHFDIPNSHSQLTITAESLVDLTPPAPLPGALDGFAWQELDTLTAKDEYWDTLMPSHYATPSLLLDELAQELEVGRRADPLTTLRELNSALYDAFDWVPTATQVDSPIDEALRMRKGVCQDFAHIMITLVRQLRIPCRYVSGYLIQHGQLERAERAANDAMHAWVEAYLPSLGWVGFDPTNDTLADERHVRVAVGRDYADVTPTRGIFRGKATTELAVTIRYAPSQTALTEDAPPELAWVAATHDEYDREQAPSQVQSQPQQQQQ